MQIDVSSGSRRNGLFMLALLSFFVNSNPTQGQTQYPNIVLILADDLGYGDLGCYGAEDIQTPVLDKLASEGVKFTQFYANGPECTPTRTALLTGRYQQRVGGLECAIGLGNIGRYDEAKKLSDAGKLGLPVKYSVLPDMLNEKGYNTAIIGKWHLGEGDEYVPLAHGFDYSIGPYGGAVDYFHHTEPVGEFIGIYMQGDHDFYRNGQRHHRDGYYMTHLITDEAVEWISNQKHYKPFFLYLPYTVPHEPLQTPEDYKSEKLTMDDWRSGTRKNYAAMVEDMDNGIGKILDKIAEKGMSDNTIIIFFSDNGPTKKGSTGDLRGNKGHVFEGGIRVPCIVRWPERIEKGITSSRTFISMDITASISALIDAKPSQKLDGIDMIGQIHRNDQTEDRMLYWRKKRGLQVRSAVRNGNLKYIHELDGDTNYEYLFDLAEDPGEQVNLVIKHKQEAEQMRELLMEWSKEVRPERYKN